MHFVINPNAYTLLCWTLHENVRLVFSSSDKDHIQCRSCDSGASHSAYSRPISVG